MSLMTSASVGGMNLGGAKRLRSGVLMMGWFILGEVNITHLHTGLWRSADDNSLGDVSTGLTILII